MEPFFTNPLTMAAGGALVSAPIIIHLINRMRFRRIKWAAMEFLLKAQKRMKRKLIIEQLILLFLRCLLIFLVGMLLARFKWFTPLEGQESRATAHVVILDDSPSMADLFTIEGKPSTAFDQAKTQIVERIAPAAAQANTPQSMDVLLLSDLRQPNDDPFTQKTSPTIAKSRPFERLNDAAIGDLRGYLHTIGVSPVRDTLVNGLRTAKEVLDKKPDADVAKVIHIVSDLRAIDWSEEGDTLRQLISEYTTAGIKVHLIDVSYPYRKDSDRQPRSSDNVSILEFKPKTRVAARDKPIDFELKVRNSGAAELKNVRFEFFKNGKDWREVAVTFASLPPNEERTEIVTAGTGLDRVGTKDNPLDRFNLITVKLADAEAGGIAADNVRHAIVEVQERLSVLVIEGQQDMRDKQKGDGFYLKRLFLDSFGGINWVDGTKESLTDSKIDLKDFAAIYLINVDLLTDAQRDRLENYTRAGGGVGFFLGPRVRPAEYSKTLYRGGTGMFPVPLAPEHTKPLTDEQKFKRALVLNKRLLTKSPAVKTHPALVGLYTGERGSAVKDVEIERFFMFANIDMHWPVQRIGQWQQDKAVQELFCLPNDKPMADFQGPARDLLKKLKAKLAEPKFEKYRQYTDPLDRNIQDTASGDLPLSALATLYDRLLCDQINDGDPSEPILREMWMQPELTDLKAEFMRERDKVKFGDPLYVVKQFGQGRVAVMTTDAGGTHSGIPDAAGDVVFTDWPSGTGAPGWLAVVAEMQKYLAGGAADENRSVGSNLRIPLDATMFQKKNGETRPASRIFLSADPAKIQPGGIPLEKKELGNQPLTSLPTGPVLDFADGKTPGGYLFTFTQFAGPEGETEKPAYAAYAFNIDAQREGDLKRATGQMLTDAAPNVPVHSAEDSSWVNALKQKRDDFSTRRWLYLFILLVLIAEQAMAVRLSFHTRPEDIELHAPSAASAYTHGTPAPIAAEALAPEPEPVAV
jgi:hypothetical protein